MHTHSDRLDIFHAIADPTRRRIMEILLDSGLVARRSEGRRRLYSMRPENLVGVHEWTEGFRDFWEGRLKRLTAYLDAEE